MKNLLLVITLSLSCLAASAQPTSFGGIKPGQTTRDELKSLVKNPGEVGARDNASLKLLQPYGTNVNISFYDDIVYELAVDLNSLPELKAALIEKYGQPLIKEEGRALIRGCPGKNGFLLEKYEAEELRWPVKEGVQGAISRLGKRKGMVGVTTKETCGIKHGDWEYLLRHVATVESAEKRRKLGDY